VGFRDLLCEQIAKRVVDIERVADERLAFVLDGDAEISVSLRPRDRTSVEAYYAHGFEDGVWYVE